MSEPVDTGFVTYAIYVTLGAGLLFPWNAFITAADYFELEFPVCRVGVIEFLVCIAQLSVVAYHCIASHYFNKLFKASDQPYSSAFRQAAYHACHICRASILTG